MSSFGNYSAAPQWAVQVPSSKNRHSSPAGSTAKQRQISSESLVIEDLDLENLDVSPLTVEAEDASSSSNPELDTNNVFGEQVPAVVSEKCLMNDLYILVKVPTNSRKYIPMSNKASQTLNKSCGPSPKSPRSDNRKICSIEELEEEEEEHSVPEPFQTQSAAKIPCWVREPSDVEEFPSRTTVLRYTGVTCLPNEVAEHIEELPRDEPRSSKVPTTAHQSCQGNIEMHEVSLNSTRFKGPTKVSLDNYGILITPTKKPKTENLLVFQVDTEQSPEDSGSGSGSCFKWFTRWFRRKRRRNGLMHAKVYKTYFVKWKKCDGRSECPRCQCASGRSLRRNST